MRAFLLLGLVLACGVPTACNRLPTGPAPGGPPIRGLTFVTWSASGYTTEAAARSLDALIETGAEDVLVLVTAYQAGPRSSTIRTDDLRTPTPAAVASVLQRARTRGLRTGIQLHVDVDDGSWRGRIEPSDPGLWFTAYGAWAEAMATLAAESGATRLVVGTELASTLRHEAAWRAVIRAVRRRFAGEVVYAASWDEAERVPFWDAVDAVGVDFYFPVAGRSNPGRAELLAGWQPWLARLESLHARTGRPLLLTEIGYRSADGAGMHPYAFGPGARYDGGEQADLYWAALQAVADAPWIAGMFWWNWPADGSGGPGNTDFTPSGKEAADVLRAAWR